MSSTADGRSRAFEIVLRRNSEFDIKPSDFNSLSRDYGPARGAVRIGKCSVVFRFGKDPYPPLFEGQRDFIFSSQNDHLHLVMEDLVLGFIELFAGGNEFTVVPQQDIARHEFEYLRLGIGNDLGNAEPLQGIPRYLECAFELVFWNAEGLGMSIERQSQRFGAIQVFRYSP